MVLATDPAMPPQKSCFRASMARESFRFVVLVFVVLAFAFALPPSSFVKVDDDDDDDDGGDCGPATICCFPSSPLFKRLVMRLTIGCGD